MSTRAGSGASSNYFTTLLAITRQSAAQLVRSPSHSRRTGAARRSARYVVLLTAVLGAAIIALMYVVDAAEIGWMPKRGTPSLWPIRILTDFGKSAYVLWTLAGLLFIVAIVTPLFRGIARFLLLGLGTRLQFLFFAVLVPSLVGETLKWAVGRGRPFVGDSIFNFKHFGGTEAFASFPSGHANTAFALAFAVSALWPQARVVMLVYAVAIALSRLVLLAHHSSDVVAGALVGVIGAVAVRYWFAARRLGFVIREDGSIVSLPGPSLGYLKRVAGGA
jgi:membrane-associated phospholipid phosphatase